ncbi:hypothetical protein [Aquibium oceanicum]|uniref:Uncharacterized protein n=1 Tax=Aquibium oceanicum TaxID=1670800 RepID=A0A1L3SM11_9HYPH|nr:hypothetical protein [Aquibium oceanicum]APH70352.1 hypothetical protein BSQ44_02365 [Aquibium oceanicum]
MQVLDIRIRPASEGDASSEVKFIGADGDDITVTIAGNTESVTGREGELVAKARVMLLHAAATQTEDRAAQEPVILLQDDMAPDPSEGLESLEEDQDNPYQNPDEALPDDAAEAQMTGDMVRQKSRFEE